MANRNNKLFVDDSHASDPMYNIINNEHEDQFILDLRVYIEKLWVDYQYYADIDFRQKIREDFHSRFWEMYLTCTLLYKSYPVKRKLKNEGPDILIEDSSHRIWIEAIAPSGGRENNLDKVRDMEYGVAQDVPDKEITLRYCGAIKDKFNKYLGYLEQNLIRPEDSFVIALNSCKIPHAIMDLNPPRIIKAVFPIGDWQLNIDKNIHKVVESGLQFRPDIKRASGSTVSTNVFLNPDYQNLSGILYSHASVGSYQLTNMGSDFIYIHNPLAMNNRVPEGYFKFGKEFIPTEDNEQYIIECREHTFKKEGN